MTTADAAPGADATEEGEPRRRGVGLAWLAVVCLVAIAVCALTQLTRGEPSLSIAEMIDAAQRSGDDTASFLVRELRAPRLIAGVVVGAALGAAGVLLQDSLRNPLADPSLLGVAQGASFAIAVVAFYPEIAPPLPTPVLALVSGTATGLLVVLVAGRVRAPIRLLLSGAVAAAFFGTITTVIILLAPVERQASIAGYQRVVTGSLSTMDWDTVWRIAPWSLPAIPIMVVSGRVLNVLKLGDDVAVTMGLDPGRARVVLMLMAMALVAPAYAYVGPVAFVALLSPHIARGALRSSDARPVLVGAACVGAAQLVAADALGRLLLFPTEIPAGIWTIAIAAAPAMWFVGRIRRAVR